MRKLGYLWVSSRILERNFYKSAQINGVEQHNNYAVQKAFKSAMDFKESWKVCISLWCHEWLAVKFTQVFFAGYTSYMNDMMSISIHKNYKAIHTYYQVLCCPESVNTKLENLMVYDANFTQCICTGYCESWILFLLSFIMNSC